MQAVIRFSVLASSSAGNATVVQAGEKNVLVDAGMSARRLGARLQELGLGWDDISAIFITHEHSDHIQGLAQIAKRRPIRIYCTRYTGHEILERAPGAVCCYFEARQTFELGELRVTPFEVSHDAVDPVGFRFECGEASLGYLTDTGAVLRHIPEFLSGVEALYLESNYDPVMLETNTTRPRHLKLRIASAQGHLSNRQACEFVARIRHANLQNLVLAHLSRECNRPELAQQAMQQTLDDWHLGTRLHCASPESILPWITVTPSQPTPP